MNRLQPTRLGKAGRACIALLAGLIRATAFAQGAAAKPAAQAGSAPQQRQFDFWIGHWDVFQPDGKQAGENLIEPILGGCALRESWQGRGGFTGTSLNAYDTTGKLWRQTWLDNQGGASVSFMHPLPLSEALAFWRGVGDAAARGERGLLVAEDASGIVGAAQLVLAQPQNQPHRADLSKMLVHRRARRRGLGQALIQAAEQLARDCGKTLLVLDTASADAERLYMSLGWQRCGAISGYALLPHGGLCDTTYSYRVLSDRSRD